ncbi:MAG: DUF2059 domain-containing protein [Pyrinomonadaceae bacterium]|nr:DUF2059 domain-containing protein [Pyrinomonadaceae bacterium]
MTKQILFISLVLLGLVQFSFGQKAVAPSKQKLVSQLVTTTEKIFPYEEFDGMIEKTRVTFSKGMEEEIGADIERRINASDKFSAEKKAEIKAKIPALTRDISNYVNVLIGKNFKIKAWVKESAAKHFAKNFTVAELQKLNNFFQSSNGQNTLLAMNQALTYGIRSEKDETNLVDADKFAKYAEKLLMTKTGEKFFKTLNKDILNDVSAELDKFGDRFLDELKESLEKKELNQMFVKFVADNIAS